MKKLVFILSTTFLVLVFSCSPESNDPSEYAEIIQRAHVGGGVNLVISNENHDNRTLLIPNRTSIQDAIRMLDQFISQGDLSVNYYHAISKPNGDNLITEMETNTIFGPYVPTTGNPVTEERTIYEGPSYNTAIDMYSNWLIYTEILWGDNCGGIDIWQSSDGTYYVADCC